MSTLGGHLLYSQTWEDVAIARQALQVRPGQTVLAIGAAGDNVLALLLDEPARLIAVDVNPAQAALIHLKRAAVAQLAVDAVGSFLGLPAGPTVRRATARGRLATYERLRRDLPAPAADWWDRQPAMLADGVLHAGRFERYLALFRRLVLSVVPGRTVLQAMLATSDTAEQRRLYEQRWNSPVWRGLFRLFFSRRLLAAFGRHPAMFQQRGIQDIGQHYLGRCAHGLTAVPVQSNPYLAYMISGGYDRPERRPCYLQPTSLARLSGLVDRLAVEQTDLASLLADLPDRSIDAFYLSDVFELFDSAAYEALLGELTRVGRPGARLCYWNNLVDRQRPPALAHVLHAHSALAAELFQRDRVFIYSRFVVESVVAA